MENTRKGNFREKWELLKSVWRGLLSGQTKYFAELVHSHDAFIEESEVTTRHCFWGFWIPGILFLIGLLVLVFSDSAPLKALALFPFYCWTFLMSLGDVLVYFSFVSNLANTVFSAFFAVVYVLFCAFGATPEFGGLLSLMTFNFFLALLFLLFLGLVSC